MTYLQALYGSQYSEIAARGKDGNKGRLNGNVFFTAFIILILIDILLVWITFQPVTSQPFEDNFHRVFGYLSGKTAGQLLAFPLFAAIYLIISKTVGSESNFQKHVEAFKQLPEAERAKANRKLLLPFFCFLAILLVLALTSL